MCSPDGGRPLLARAPVSESLLVCNVLVPADIATRASPSDPRDLTPGHPVLGSPLAL